MDLVGGHDCLIFFNAKYDLHWLKRLGVPFEGKKIWCCQVAHFLLSNQRNMYPSLDEVCEYYGIRGKLTTAADYWNRGIDTPDIPKEIMVEYLQQDLRSTYEVYTKQQDDLAKRPELRNLMKMQMDDLLVLQDMEWNGLRLNVEECEKQEKQARKRMVEIEAALMERCPNTPINWDSGDHVSAYIYGGIIEIDRREPVGLFKSGKKVGEVRYRKVTDYYPLPRLCEPTEEGKLKKDGVWSTAEDILKQLKPKREEIELLLERAHLSKLLDYLTGWPTLMKEKDWTGNEVHGQFNQVVARTGRLSSSNPNLQNLPDPMLKLIESRYDKR
jgi:DNA polymerase I-like protein with 3'-5' exonuclease and polymerase domains